MSLPPRSLNPDLSGGQNVHTKTHHQHPTHGRTLYTVHSKVRPLKSTQYTRQSAQRQTKPEHVLPIAVHTLQLTKSTAQAPTMPRSPIGQSVAIPPSARLPSSLG
ncbi:hypothetical protein BaRGS_00016592 [Batillaria attramentaria]|uniref:Uncharacterized protein n=1 Tax=Batillaria attramentaria TaxID=370345 RepID=A0ABD0J0S3_9CAEN